MRWSLKILLTALLCAISMAGANTRASTSSKSNDRMSEQARAIQLASLQQGMIEFHSVLDKARNVPVLVSMLAQLDPNAIDLRGRTIADDFRDYVLSRDELSQVYSEMDAFSRALSFNDVDEAQMRGRALFELLSPLDSHRASIVAYWGSVRDMQREQRMWTHSLERNHLNSKTPHNKAVVDAEARLRTVLLSDSPAKESWRDALKDYVSALIDDRNNVARSVANAHLKANDKQSANQSGVNNSVTPPLGSSGASRAEVPIMIGPSTFVQAKLKRPLPNLDDFYPSHCKTDGEEGVVILMIKVDKVGHPHDAEVIASSGSDALDQAALAFYEKLQYEPAQTGGSPAETTLRLPIYFKLDERRDYAQKKEQAAIK